MTYYIQGRDGPPRLALSGSTLAETLAQRFGAARARAVMSALGIEPDSDGVPLQTIELAACMALDAELLSASDCFAAHPHMSALAATLAFRRAAERAGVRVESLDCGQRLRIDAAFAERWRGCRRLPRSGEAAASLSESLMTDVLLDLTD